MITSETRHQHYVQVLTLGGEGWAAGESIRIRRFVLANGFKVSPIQFLSAKPTKKHPRTVR
jgi:hypothetical protein